MKFAIKQLSIFLENKEGELNDLTKALSSNDVALKSIMLVDSNDFGIVRMLVDNPEKAKVVLDEAGFSVRITDVFGVKIKDRIGSFNAVVQTLSKAHVNINYTYSFYEDENGIFIFSVSQKDFAKATLSLAESGTEVVSAQHFYA